MLGMSCWRLRVGGLVLRELVLDFCKVASLFGGVNEKKCWSCLY
jgi:hypothetical protein